MLKGVASPFPPVPRRLARDQEAAPPDDEVAAPAMPRCCPAAPEPAAARRPAAASPHQPPAARLLRRLCPTTRAALPTGELRTPAQLVGTPGTGQQLTGRTLPFGRRSGTLSRRNSAFAALAFALGCELPRPGEGRMGVVIQGRQGSGMQERSLQMLPGLGRAPRFPLWGKKKKAPGALNRGRPGNWFFCVCMRGNGASHGWLSCFIKMRY